MKKHVVCFAGTDLALLQNNVNNFLATQSKNTIISTQISTFLLNAMMDVHYTIMITYSSPT